MPPNTDTEIRDELIRQTAELTGIPLDIARKLAGVTGGTTSSSQPGVHLSNAELLSLVDPFIKGFFVPGPDSEALFRGLAAVSAEERETLLVQLLASGAISTPPGPSGSGTSTAGS